MKTHTIIFFIVIGFFSCNGGSLDSLEDWLSNDQNGMIQTIENESFVAALSFIPVEVLIAREYKNNLTEEIYKRELSERNGMQYFNLKLSSKKSNEMLKSNVSSEDEYYRRLNYFLNEFENDIKLIDGKDTLNCKLYHFERNYGVTNFNMISLGFKNVNQNKDKKTMYILDRALGLGLQKFEFTKEQINKIPSLKI